MSKGKDIGGVVYFLFIVLMMAFGIIKNVLEQKAKRRALPSSNSDWDDGEDWEDWESEPVVTQRTVTVRPASAPTPSARVEAILHALEGQKAARVQKSAPAPQPRVTVAAPAAKSQQLTQVQTTVQSQLGQVQSTVQSRQPDVSGTGASPALAYQQQSTRAAYGQTLGKAFPEDKRASGRYQAGTKPPIRLCATGRLNVRRAILMAEVLGQPRAFDV